MRLRWWRANRNFRPIPQMVEMQWRAELGPTMFGVGREKTLPYKFIEAMTCAARPRGCIR